MAKIELKVEGMTCGHCERTVEEVIRAAGATGKADRVAGVAHITYDENSDQLAKICAGIEENGYSVKN
jgi:copper chaperone